MPIFSLNVAKIINILLSFGQKLPEFSYHSFQKDPQAEICIILPEFNQGICTRRAGKTFFHGKRMIPLFVQCRASTIVQNRRTSRRLRIHSSVLSRVHANTNTCNSWLRNPEDGSAGRVKSDNVSAVNKGLLRETCVYPPSTKRRPVTASGDSACSG